jgi:hypothetical protein
MANGKIEILIHVLSHLNPQDLFAVALVSRQFHHLVNSPDAWRAAFTRIFPGALVLGPSAKPYGDDENRVQSSRLSFCRISETGSWRDEYIMRTRLLGSLARARRVHAVTGTSPSDTPRRGVSYLPYASLMAAPVTHLHSTFEGHRGMNGPLVAYGSHFSGEAGAGSFREAVYHQSPTEGFLHRQFRLGHSRENMWGLGSGAAVGNDNPMDVSATNGLVYGEGIPGGRAYWYTAQPGAVGKILPSPISQDPTTVEESSIGVPRSSGVSAGVSALYIAKGRSIPAISGGLVGMLCGFGSGIISSYSLGHSMWMDKRLEPGERTASWILSPGVPIISIAVDESYSPKRHTQNRIWAVALNALGEVFYLTKFPRRPPAESRARFGTRLDWKTGRSVHWTLIESTRRAAKPDPFNDREVDGSYTPRSSWDGMCLSAAQVRAETSEMETFLSMTPMDFRQTCQGWDMQRRMEVDFAGDDGHYAGEAVAVFECGVGEDGNVDARRHVRFRIKPKDGDGNHSVTAAPGREHLQAGRRSASPVQGPASVTATDASADPPATLEEWRSSTLSFGTKRKTRITAVAMDCSKFATMTLSEDPAVRGSGDARSKVPVESISGRRGRFIAAGTDTGVIYLWDMRSAMPRSAESTTCLSPLRVMHTESPQISSLAMTALYLVHGGSDGLVQVWDPLASKMEPIRTLWARLRGGSRQAILGLQSGLPPALEINLLAAGTAMLDPDPTVLSGVIAMGTYVHPWSFVTGSGKAGGKRRRRRAGERGSSTPSPAQVRRADLALLLEEEVKEALAEQKAIRRERQRLASRFGAGWLGEDDELQLALMLSQETFEREARESSGGDSPVEARGSSVADDGAESGSGADSGGFDEEDISEAIRRSLREWETSAASSPAGPVTPSSAEQGSGVQGRGGWSTGSPRAGSSAAAGAELVGETSEPEAGKGKGRAL